MKRKILTLLIAALLLFTCVISASAEDFNSTKTGSISVTLTDQQDKSPIVGAELSVYYVATVSINSAGQMVFVYTDDFAQAGISMHDPEFVAKLDAYLSENEVPAIRLYTDETGTAHRDVQLGLFFIRQTNLVEGFAPCTPFLVTVPMETAEGYVYHVNASPKTEVTKLTSITIQKVWNTDASATAADSVTVQLLRNDQVVETAVLNEANNWQITYTNMPQSDAYRIQEVDVPKGFTATYKQNGYVFTVTNTATLAQTGQLVWPIPVLALAGVLLIALGSVLLQKKRDPDA